MNPLARKGLCLFATVLLGGLTLNVLADDAAPAEWKAPESEAGKKNPITADAASIDAGKDIFSRNCATCHGAGGKGDGPFAAMLGKPLKDLADKSVADQSDGTLFYKITTGKMPMPAFEKMLSEEDRWKLVNFIRSLAPKPTTAPAGG